MKVRDTIKLLLDDTWYQVSQTGSHRQYKHPTKPGRVTVDGMVELHLEGMAEDGLLTDETSEILVRRISVVAG
ncbi:MAG: addiction module toxin, HicA family [Actinobacteria bacterium]|nr:addiction module toxin, HicA family [Actinomycetota bacterium]